jgi:hypothetical protein
MGVGTEMAIEGGMQGVFGLGFKLTSWGFKGFGKMIGMSRPYVQDIMERTRKVGLPVSALISLTPFTRIVTRVGGVLPVIGAPVKRAIGEIEIRTSEATLGLLGRISPVVDIPALARSLGKSLSISDIGSLRARHTVVDSAIEGLRSIAERAGNPEVIPVQPIVAAATSALKTVREMPKVVRSTTRESTVDVQTVRTPGPKEPEDGFVPRLTETDKVVQEVAPRAGRSTTTEGRTETFGAETTKRVRTYDTALDEQMAGPSPLSKVLTEELENIVLLAERGKMSVTETMAMLEGLLKNVRKASAPPAPAAAIAPTPDVAGGVSDPDNTIRRARKELGSVDTTFCAFSTATRKSSMLLAVTPVPFNSLSRPSLEPLPAVSPISATGISRPSLRLATSASNVTTSVLPPPLAICLA